MANTSNVNGLTPVRFLSGAAWNGAMETFFVPASDATAIGVGDLVKISGLSDAVGIRGVTKAAVGDAVVGTMVEAYFNPVNLNSPTFRPASTAQYIYVCTDPNVLYSVQVSGTVGVADVGLNANHADAGVTAATGMSGETLDGSTKAATAALTLKIIEVEQKVGNDGTLTSARVLVKINNHQYGSGTGTVGVA